MYLPYEAINNWFSKIKDSPVLDATKKHLEKLKENPNMLISN